MWMYDRAEDFVLGLAVGMIYAYFEGTFLTIYHRQIDPQERVEVMSVITLRMPQIREALFSTGRLQCLIVIFLNIVLRNMTTRIRVEFEKHSVLLLIIAAVVADPFYLLYSQQTIHNLSL